MTMAVKIGCFYFRQLLSWFNYTEILYSLKLVNCSNNITRRPIGSVMIDFCAGNRNWMDYKVKFEFDWQNRGNHYLKLPNITSTLITQKYCMLWNNLICPLQIDKMFSMITLYIKHYVIIRISILNYDIVKEKGISKCVDR